MGHIDTQLARTSSSTSAAPVAATIPASRASSAAISSSTCCCVGPNYTWGQHAVMNYSLLYLVTTDLRLRLPLRPQPCPLPP